MAHSFDCWKGGIQPFVEVNGVSLQSEPSSLCIRCEHMIPSLVRELLSQELIHAKVVLYQVLIPGAPRK